MFMTKDELAKGFTFGNSLTFVITIQELTTKTMFPINLTMLPDCQSSLEAVPHGIISFKAPNPIPSAQNIITNEIYYSSNITHNEFTIEGNLRTVMARENDTVEDFLKELCRDPAYCPRLSDEQTDLYNSKNYVPTLRKWYRRMNGTLRLSKPLSPEKSLYF